MSIFSENFLSPSLHVWARGVVTALSVSLRVTQSPGTSVTCVTSASHGGTTSLSTSGRSTTSNGPQDILASGTAPLSSPQYLLCSAGHSWSCLLHCAGCAWALMFGNVLKSLFPVAEGLWAVNIQWDLCSAGWQLQDSGAAQGLKPWMLCPFLGCSPSPGKGRVPG